MLLELKIENFGIIEAQRLRPDKGLNIISGETGSGKSLVMSALDVVLGSRAGPGLVRNGAHRAVVEAVFELSDAAAKKPIQGVTDGSQYLELRREVTLEGRSRIYCNGELTTLGHIRAIASRLIETHGQHEHQRILDTDTHLDFLDIFAETQGLCSEVAELYHRFSSISNRLRSVGTEAEEREHRRGFLHFALEELESFVPREGEFEELNAEKALIQNSGKLFQDICAAYSMMREEDLAILDRLYSVVHLLEPHCDLLPEAQGYLEQVQEASYLLEAAADFLREQKGRLQFSPERLEDVDERLTGYQRLHKKYGGSTRALLHAQNKYLQELGSIEMSSEQMEELERELEGVQSRLFQKAEELSRLRRAVIPDLEKKLARELDLLGMPGAFIQICLKREVDLAQANEASQYLPETTSRLSSVSLKNKYLIHAKGFDRIEFLLIANPGEAARPLRKIVSGGELSRVSLAFKSIFFDERPVGTVLFDEIDAGVGGEVAHTIGKKLAELAGRSQVLVVTHLPQIARLARQHFCVFKEYAEGRVHSRIKRLREEERLRELARMLGGEEPGPVVLEHARELLVQKQAACS